MRLPELIKFAKEMAVKHPALKGQIYELVEMARDEIADGGSEDNECELAFNDIQKLIKE